MIITINLPKFKWVWLNTRLKSFRPLLNGGPKSLGSNCIPNPLKLGEDARPKSIGSWRGPISLGSDSWPNCLGKVRLQDLWDFGLSPATPKQLGFDMPFKTQVNNNKNNWFYPLNHIYVFFDSNKIYFKFNNFNEFNNIYDINNNIKLIWPKFLKFSIPSNKSYCFSSITIIIFFFKFINLTTITTIIIILPLKSNLCFFFKINDIFSNFINYDINNINYNKKIKFITHNNIFNINYNTNNNICNINNNNKLTQV